MIRVLCVGRHSCRLAALGVALCLTSIGPAAARDLWIESDGDGLAIVATADPRGLSVRTPSSGPGEPRRIETAVLVLDAGGAR